MSKLRPARTRVLSLVALVATVPLALTACGGSDSGGSGSGGGATAAGGVQLVQPGKLLVCTHLSYKPFQFNQDGKTVGFDVDIVDLAAKKLGVTQQIVDIPFEQITSGAVFKAKKCDIAAAGITITDARKQAVAFSAPYFDANQSLLVKKGSGLNSLAALKGKKVGVQTDTTGQDYVKKNAEANGYTVVVFDDLPTEVNAVKAGRVDAAVNDNGVLLDFAKDNPDTEVTAEFQTGEHYGIEAPLNDPNGTKLLEAINSAVDASRKDGSYDEIYKKWFGTTPGVKEAGGSASPSASASSS